MSLLNSDVVPALPTGGYTIDQSLRFNADDSAYLSWTPSSASNRKTWTFSAWVKRGNLGINTSIFSAGTTEVTRFTIRFTSNDQLYILDQTSGTYQTYLLTTQKFRDTSSWYHIVFAVDSTQATASNRERLYINGEEVTAWDNSDYVSQNADFHINNSIRHNIAIRGDIAEYFDGYIAEVNFIDGQSLDPSYFGETGDYGEWKPIEYTGSYGTNGFYLDFDGTYYNDKSGNGNNWTANNLTTTDVVLDSPTNNFATWNALDKGQFNGYYTSMTTTEGNLKANGDASTITASFLIPKTGKWYWESVNGQYASTGVISHNMPRTGSGSGLSIQYYTNAGNVDTKDNSGSSSTPYDGSSGSGGEIIGIALNMDDGEITFYRNNSLFYTLTSLPNGSDDQFMPACGFAANTDIRVNFGQDSSFAGNKTAQGNTDGNNIGDFYYTPPSGYLALCTANLPDPDVIPSENFNTVLYNGNGSSQSITGVGFQPDWLWLKTRSATGNHVVYDAVRGTSARLRPSSTAAEDSNSITSFNSDGFTLATEQNSSSTSYVAWNWKANGSGSSNTNGSITSTVSANQDAGFSIVNFTGSTNESVGHGLSQAPECIFVKDRDATSNWAVYHQGVQDNTTNGFLELNTTSALQTGSNPRFLSGTASTSQPTSTVFYVNNYSGSSTNNTGNDYIAYCFHSVDGFSKVGSYTGNGSSDGTFVYTGFRPAYVMYKRTDSSSGAGWRIADNPRSGYRNEVDQVLRAESTSAEGNYAGTDVDFLSNGFKLRGTDSIGNASGSPYIYIAFAENPFKHTNAR